MNKAFFYDRDGIIIKMIYDLDSGKIHIALNPPQVAFTPGIFELLKTTSQFCYKNIIISNQPNIGLNKIKEQNFEKVRKKIKETFKQKNVLIDGEYYCFHHPYADIKKYRIKCDCRKPKIGLILKAAEEYQLDLKQSFIIGDGVNDIVAGHNAGCKTILVVNLLETEYLRIIEQRLGKIKPDYLVRNLKEAVSLIKKINK